MRKACVILAILLCPAVARAQDPSATVKISAPIYIRPQVTTPLRVAAVGTILQVLEEQPDWLRVEFQDPQWGIRVGWVQRNLVTMASMQPMDLSVRDTPPSGR
jgi:hypothetical protein